MAKDHPCCPRDLRLGLVDYRGSLDVAGGRFPGFGAGDHGVRFPAPACSPCRGDPGSWYVVVGVQEKARYGLTPNGLAPSPVWLAASLANMWIGVSRTGYSVAEELPIFLAIFLIPGIAAAIVWWKLSSGSPAA
jgi:hypothetical protein